MRLTPFLLGLLLIPLSVSAQDAPDEAQCRASIDNALGREVRMYRSVLFGWGPAKDAAVGDVRFTEDGKTWYKASQNVWWHIGELQADNEEENDSFIDTEGETDIFGNTPEERRGIFATKRVLTSDLIPYITDAARDFQCRIELTCARALQSIRTDGEERDPQTLEINLPGCVPVDADSFPGCHFGNTVADTASSAIHAHCHDTAAKLFEHEMQLLTMVTEYDASYRSLSQFAGIFDEFLLQLRWLLTGNLRDAASMIGWLSRFPCFLGTCDDAPPPHAPPPPPVQPGPGPVLLQP